MSAKLAVNVRKACYLLLDGGLNPSTVEEALKNLNQPTAGYYYAEDVLNVLRQERN